MKSSNELFNLHAKQRNLENINIDLVDELKEIKSVLKQILSTLKDNKNTTTVIERVVESSSNNMDKFKTKQQPKVNEFIPTLDVSSYSVSGKKSKNKSINIDMNNGPNPLT